MNTQEIYGPVLLVCIFNKHGNIITHDYFYQLFSQHGDVQKILIFEKAKVWKTFIQFSDVYSARCALQNLNNWPVFDDGSKMNIFSSKLKHIQLQNHNLGGVNYEELKQYNEPFQEVEQTRSRKRTMDCPSVSKSNGSCVTYMTDSPPPNEEFKNYSEQSSTFSLGSDIWGDMPCSLNSFGVFDIDEQFREIAMESQEFRQLQKGQEEEITRKKSKTFISNPNTQQFLFENSPCKVLFVRSIPQVYTNQTIYNIFRNFGKVGRIIYFRDKKSALVEFEDFQDAISAKDELNYAKTEMKLFYSHYQTLEMRKESEEEEFCDYTSLYSKNQSQTSNKALVNPPSETLYLTYVNPSLEEEIKNIFWNIGCPAVDFQWKENGKKDKWMCLVQFENVQKALIVMGFLQSTRLSNGKSLKISFTKSKINHKLNDRIIQRKYRQKASNY